MKRYIYLFKAAATSLLFIVLTTSGTFAQSFSPATEARLQAVLDAFQAEYRTGGMAAAINVDGLAVWEGATGYASQATTGYPYFFPQPGGESFTTNTLSRIYSITKTFTAALTLELVNEGVLNLNDPISKFFPIQNYNAGLNPNVTIHQLLSHESGYSDFLTNPAILGAVAGDPAKSWQPFEVLPFASQLQPPGGTRIYSSTNYIILGMIIEAATGTPVEELYRERFFDPLNLETAYLAGRESNVSGGKLASPHENLQLLDPRIPFPLYTNIGFLPFTGIESIAWTTGGIVMDVGDLAEWGNALYGGRATSRQTLDLMINSMAPTPDADGDYLGYGLWRNTKIDDEDLFYGHNGSAPGYRSLMFYQPDRQMTIAIVSNFSGAQLYEVAAALYDALPDFLGGNENRKEAKIVMCWKGKNHTVARNAAQNFMQKGAYLGGCEVAIVSKGKSKSVAMKQQTSLSEIESLLIAYPNPSRNSFNFRIKATESGNTNLSIYDMSGRLINVAFNGYMQKGEQKTIHFNGSKLGAGHYFSRLLTPDGQRQQKLVIER